MAQVEIINPKEVAQLIQNHGLFACTCYNTPDKYAKMVGLTCLRSGHMSGSRCEYIKFRITGDRGTLEQIMRHEIGTDYDSREINIAASGIVKNMKSFRYCKMDDFDYYVPQEVINNDRALLLYDAVMTHIKTARASIKELLTKDGVPEKRATECAANLLTRGTMTTLTIGFTVEALVNFMHLRLCTRAQSEIREIAAQMRDCVRKIDSNIAAMLMPQCEHLLYCPEENGCGRKESKAAVKAKIERANLRKLEVSE